MNEKPIVIYYPQTDITKRAAEKIQKIAHSDIYEIISEWQYDSDMWKAYEEAKEELQTRTMPKLSGAVPVLANYIKIYLGGPVWGGKPANPMKVFLQQADFHGNPFFPSGHFITMREITKKK